MKQSLIKILTLTLALLAGGSAWAEPLRVGMFIDATSVDGIASPQEKAAAQWFKTAYVDAGKGAFITKTTDASTLTTANYSTIWVNIDREGYIQDALTDYLNTNLEAFKSYFNAGGSFYLSKMATDMVALLGRTSIKPNQANSGDAGDYNSANDWWGINPYINYNAIATNGWYRDNTSHPIFAGLASKSYNGAAFEIYPLIGCEEGGSFQRYDHNWCWNLASVDGLQGDGANNAIKFEETCVAKVLGTWNHVTGIEAATVVEFYPLNGQGRIIANGASSYQWNDANVYTSNMEKLTDNTIQYLVNTNRNYIYLGMWIDGANVGAISSTQEKNAAEWFMETVVSTGHGEFITTNTDATNTITTKNYKCVWLNIDRIGYDKGTLPDYLTANVATFKNYFNARGNLYLTKFATQYLVNLERINVSFAPNIYGNGGVSDITNVNDIWGINAHIGFNNVEANPSQYYEHANHAIYSEIPTINYPGNTYTIIPLAGCADGGTLKREDHNCCWDLNAYSYTSAGVNTVEKFQADNNCIVIGTWGHVTDYAVAAVVEFNGNETGIGGIIANGYSGYQWSEGNAYQAQMEALTLNSLNYLAGYHWDSVNGGVSGAEDVEIAPAEDGPARFFNLQGIEVDGSNLTPGIYIRLQGNKTTKFLVK